MDSKYCRRCGEMRSLEEFYKDRRTNNGYSTYCGACIKERAKSWARENRDKINENSKRWQKINYDKEEARQKNREYYLKNRDKIINKQRQRYWNPKNKVCEKCGCFFSGTKDDKFCSVDCMFAKATQEVYGKKDVFTDK